MWNDASKKDKIYATVILLQDRQIVHMVVFLFRNLFQNALTKEEDAEVYSRSNICRMLHKPGVDKYDDTNHNLQASKQASKLILRIF